MASAALRSIGGLLIPAARERQIKQATRNFLQNDALDLHKGPQQKGRSAPWIIKGEKDPNVKTGRASVGADVPWDD
jgi:hypothetical protein